MSSTHQQPQFDAFLDNSLMSALLDATTSEDVYVTIRIAMKQYQRIGIPVIACAETYYGIEFSPNLLATYDDFYTHLGGFPIIPVTASTIKSYLVARRAVPLEKKRLNDTWIAASALEHEATVLTGDNDFDDFAEQGLIVHKVPTI